MKSFLVCALALSFSSQLFAQSTNQKDCSLLSGTVPLTIINKLQTAETISSSFANGMNSSISMSNNKILNVSTYGWGTYADATGTMVSGSISTQYAAPIRFVRNTFVADLSKAIQIGEQMGSSFNSGIKIPLSIFSQGAFVMSYDAMTRDMTISLQKKGEKTSTVIGKAIAYSLNMSDPRFFIVKNASGQLEKLDVKTGLRVPHFNLALDDLLKKGNYTGTFMPDGERLILAKDQSLTQNSSPGQLLDLVLVGASITELKGNFESSDRRILSLNNGEKVQFGAASSWKQSLMSTDYELVKNGQVMASLKTVSPNYYMTASNSFLFVTEMPSSAKYMISAEKIKCDLPLLETSSADQFVLPTIGGQQSCSGKQISAAEWDQVVGLTPEKVLAKSRVSKFEADYMLQRILRQESLSITDAGFIEMVAKSPIASEFNDLIVVLVQKYGTFVKYRNLNMLKIYPGAPTKLEGKMGQICFSDNIKTSISAAYKEIVLQKLKDDKARDPYSFNIQNLLFIKKYLGILSEQHKQDIAYDAGTLLAEATQIADHNLRDVFFSTLDWISTQKAREVLGLKATRLTDFIPSTQASYRNFVLGTDDIYGEGDLVSGASVRARGGFYYLAHPDSSFNNTGAFQKTYTWSLGGETFEADHVSTPRPLNFKMEPVAGPNKAELLDDKIFYGMVVVGANIQGADADSIKDNYLYYLESQGFTLYEDEEIPDALAYIKDRISGKEEKLDFFLKEAHSDGDYRNLFSISKKMFKVRAERQTGEISEIVDFVYHDNLYNPTFISNQDFSDWLKIRETEKLGGQLIYLNTSCSSYTKAAAELGTAASKNLVVVASATTVYTFTSDPDNNATHFLFDGMMKLKTFDEIAASLTGMKGEYIFPNQQRYQDMVTSKINAGFDTSTKIFRITADGDRKPFQIEQAINSGH